MQTQRKELLKVLPDYGWEVVEVYEKSKDVRWTEDWADEILTVQSVWSPQGFRAYIYFLVDPFYFDVRDKGEKVWAIGVSARFDSLKPTPLGEYDYFPINKGHWKESLQKVLDMLNRLQQTAVNETSLV